MTNTLLDFSHQPELALHARVIADVQAVASSMGIATLIAGAFARDLHLMYRAGIGIRRQTEDIDLAVAVPDWAAFEVLSHKLTSSGAFEETTTSVHRLRHRSGWPVDLLPFDGVESSDRKIAWPPRGEFVMSVFGFREALANAHPVALPGQVQTQLVSLAALAVLKIVCWQERHYTSPRKDAHDLQLILRHYLVAEHEARLWNEFSAWTQGDDFEYELAGPRMLGHDMARLLEPDGQDQIAKVLCQQVRVDAVGPLPFEMNSVDPARAITALSALLRGLQEA
jgi:predicted nucleotidyltransferase